MSFAGRIWRLGNLVVLLILLISLRIVYWQLVRAPDLQPVALDPLEAAAEYFVLQAREQAQVEIALTSLAAGDSLAELDALPQPVVQRTMDLLASVQRGEIADRSGRRLAYETAAEDGTRTRFYTEPSLAHLVGAVSGLRTGVSGLEKSYNDTLLGLNRPDARLGQLMHEKIIGSDLLLTIDSRVQRAAAEALEGHAGAVLVLDARTGAVLAMASAPGYDPNRFLDADYYASLLQDCPPEAACQGALINRVTQARYTPGSTWKTVALIAGLDSGFLDPQREFDFGEPRTGEDGRPYYVFEIDGGVVPDPNHREDRLSLEMSYAKSANAAFARIGAELPAEVLIEYAGRLGFNEPDPDEFLFEVPAAPAQLAKDVQDLYTNNLLRAVTAIGQGELLVAPLDMARVVLAVYNDGDLPLQYVVESIRAPSGSVASGPLKGRTISAVMQPETARLVRQMMVTVVERGSGTRAQIPGATVGGKTGTAQVGGNREPHAWFMGFAENEDRAVAVVVLIENGGEGSQSAAPVFAQLAELALTSPADLLAEPLPEVVPDPPEPAGNEGDENAQAGGATPEGPPAGGASLSPTATPGIPGLPEPDIPYRSDRTDFTELARTTCPGNDEPVVGSGEFSWPSVYQSLSGGDFREGHPGIDLGTPEGTPVHAADAGRVIFAGWSGIGYGNTVVIDHGNGFITLYAHLSQVSTYCGAKVESGKLIGMSGSTGNSSGAHLHFEVRVPGGYLNPLKVLPTP